MGEFEAEKRQVLRRTLSIVSALYAAVDLLLLVPLLSVAAPAGSGDLLAPRTLLWIMVAHGVTHLAVAVGAPRPRRWAGAALLVALLNSGLLAALLFLKGDAVNGVMCAVYPPLAATLFLKGRPPA